MADTTFLPKPFIYSTIIIILKPLNKNRTKTKSARQDSKIICDLTYKLNFPELSDLFQLLLKLLYISSLMPSVLPAKNYTSINQAKIFCSFFYFFQEFFSAGNEVITFSENA